MDLSTFEQLLSPLGEHAIEAARELRPTATTYPACVDRLSRRVPNLLARAALETVMLRERAAAKFSQAHELFFTREALEMASSERVAAYRARRFQPFSEVGDWCCGIGADAMALARLGCRVLAVDRDPLRLRMAEENLKRSGLTGRFMRADVIRDPMPALPAVFVDPSRRSGDRRFLSIHKYEPSVCQLLDRKLREVPAGVKVAPGVPWEDIEPLPAEREFISLEGELKECVLWFGALRTANIRVTVLPSGETLTGERLGCLAPLGPIRRYLLDPDPAVTRAGLVDQVAEKLSAHRLDRIGACLTSDSPTVTAFAKVYTVWDVLPLRWSKITAWMRSHQVGRCTVIRRGPAGVPEDAPRGLKLQGSRHVCVVLTTIDGCPKAILCNHIQETQTDYS